MLQKTTPASVIEGIDGDTIEFDRIYAIQKKENFVEKFSSKKKFMFLTFVISVFFLLSVFKIV